MKVLLVGANGQIGHELRRLLIPFAELVSTTRTGALPGGGRALALDLNDATAIEDVISSVRPNAIINAAAYTQVDRAESDPAAAMRLNHAAPLQLAQSALRHCALLVHYSSDYVFDGHAAEALCETDAVAPLSSYGRSKLAGEKAILASNCPHIILRTQWVYSARGSNFLLTMLKLAREGKRLSVVSDQIGAPTPAAWIASATLAVLSKWRNRCLGNAFRGVYHVSAAGHCSWFEFAQGIFALARERGLLDRQPELFEVSTLQYGAAAPRPAWSVLDNRRIRNDFDVRLPEWQTGLEQVLLELHERLTRSE
jgi:dTDP-4-dehydrorhamnose reductase